MASGAIGGELSGGVVRCRGCGIVAVVATVAGVWRICIVAVVAGSTVVSDRGVSPI